MTYRIRLSSRETTTTAPTRPTPRRVWRNSPSQVVVRDCAGACIADTSLLVVRYPMSRLRREHGEWRFAGADYGRKATKGALRAPTPLTSPSLALVPE